MVSGTPQATSATRQESSNGTPINWESRLTPDSGSSERGSTSGSPSVSPDGPALHADFSPHKFTPYNMNAMIPTANAVPSNLDKESYLAGEKAALIRVFQEVLPSQQAMGALAASVHHLQEQVQEVRASSDAVKGLQATVQSQNEQIHTLERYRIPEMESQMQQIQRNSCPKELVNVLGAIHGLHETTIEEARWRRKTAAERLIITGCAWARGSLSQMDVAMLFMSRWLLLGKPWSGQEPGTLAVTTEEGRQQILRAAALICSVEASWRGMQAVEKVLPWPINRLAAWPAKPALSAMRIACWGALVVLLSHEARSRWPQVVEGVTPYLHRLYHPGDGDKAGAAQDDRHGQDLQP